MESLWAPWRMEYIRHSRGKECIFCKGLKGNSSVYILYKSLHNVIMLNKYPYNCGHIMISPKKHTNELSELTHAELSDFVDLLSKSIKVIKKTLKPDGFNIGMNLGRLAGAGVEDHLHLHIVPRWNGDTNFMPVVSKTKVLPEHLDITYQKLFKHFKKLS